MTDQTTSMRLSRLPLEFTRSNGHVQEKPKPKWYVATVTQFRLWLEVVKVPCMLSANAIRHAAVAKL